MGIIVHFAGAALLALLRALFHLLFYLLLDILLAIALYLRHLSIAEGHRSRRYEGRQFLLLQHV